MNRLNLLDRYQNYNQNIVYTVCKNGGTSMCDICSCFNTKDCVHYQDFGLYDKKIPVGLFSGYDSDGILRRNNIVNLPYVGNSWRIIINGHTGSGKTVLNRGIFDSLTFHNVNVVFPFETKNEMCSSIYEGNGKKIPKGANPLKHNMSFYVPRSTFLKFDITPSEFIGYHELSFAIREFSAQELAQMAGVKAEHIGFIQKTLYILKSEKPNIWSIDDFVEVIGRMEKSEELFPQTVRSIKAKIESLRYSGVLSDDGNFKYIIDDISKGITPAVIFKYGYGVEDRASMNAYTARIMHQIFIEQQKGINSKFSYVKDNKKILKPMLIILDEGRYLMPPKPSRVASKQVIETLFTMGRSYNVSVILSNQYFSQIDQDLALDAGDYYITFKPSGNDIPFIRKLLKGSSNADLSLDKISKLIFHTQTEDIPNEAALINKEGRVITFYPFMPLSAHTYEAGINSSEYEDNSLNAGEIKTDV